MNFLYPKKIINFLFDEKISAYNRLKKSDYDNLIFQLTNFHKKKCKFYQKIIAFSDPSNKKIENLPPVPSRMFKFMDLLSIPKNQVFKTMYSSGTSGLESKIFLDRESSIRQIKALKKILLPIIGKKRLPMIIADSLESLKNGNHFNAKKAAISGFSVFGKDYLYLLNKHNQLNFKLFKHFIKKHKNEEILIFGFTDKIYEIFLQNYDFKKINFSLSNCILIHGGGWKKLEKTKISNNIFKRKLYEIYNFKKIINYYGMIEQTGSIFFECEKCGAFRATCFSDIFVRDKEFMVKESGRGLLQLFSLLPSSYPGHNIITEDEGEILENKCLLCKNNKRFIVYGRAKESEMRGCSNV